MSMTHRRALVALATLALGCDQAAIDDLGARRSAYCRLVGCGGDPNGAGVLNIEGGAFEVKTPVGPLFLYGFRNVSNRVEIYGDLLKNGVWTSFSSGLSGYVSSKPVILHRIAPSKGTWLQIEWEDGNQKVFVTDGADLTSFELEFIAEAVQYRLRLGKPAAERDIFLYDLEWEIVGANSWTSLCRGLDHTTPAPASFLGDVRFDANSGRRLSAPGTTSLSCRDGGVTTCMLWGYDPSNSAWNGATGHWETLEAAHGACVQMKRDAYCVAFGDNTAYTVKGTPIEIADPYLPSINGATVQAIEAVWTNDGANCFDPSHQRHPELGLPSCAAQLPLCSPSPSSWWPKGHTANGIFK